MRRLALVGCLFACAEWRMAPTFPEQAAGRPVIHEQAVVGLSAAGDLAAVQLVDADGEAPSLALLAFGRGGEPTRTLLEALPERAMAVARRLRSTGHQPAPLLGPLVALEWPDATARAAQLGYVRRAPEKPAADGATWRVTGMREAGALPLLIRASEVAEPAPAVALLLSDLVPGLEVELARMPVAGASFAPELWMQGGVVWLLAGSVAAGQPLHRALGLRRALLSRGEARLHDLHGLAALASSEVEAARREFGRAMAADPTYAEGVYDAAVTEATAGHAEEAVDLLRRAAALDPIRIQVRGRNDEALAALRRRADVRALLGMHRLPPEGVPPPP
jgi:tetratricopeptide (TPR) repeat protein